MKRHINYYFLAATVALLGFGILFLATLSAIASLNAFGNTNHYLFHQLIAVAIGLVGGIIFFKVPLPVIKKFALPLLFFNILLLIVVFIPVLGTKIWGAKRWISVAGNTIQPSEFLKLTSVLYLSAFLSSRVSGQSKKGWSSLAKKSYENFIHVFLPFLLLLGVITIILFFQKDLSTLGIVGITLVGIYFCAGTPLWNTIVLLISGIGSALLLVKIEPYRVQRFLVFLHPEADPLGIGFQLKQAILAVGSGGWFGKGLGMSTAKFGFLPQAMSDSVFAIIGEELGLIGCAILISLFVFFFWQIISISKNSNDTFSKLAAVGIAIWMLLQAFMNIGSSIGIFPLAGIPLPFFSYGGSHVIAELMAAGLLLNISKSG